MSSPVSLRKLGRYELVRVLGKGAMGIVYEGGDPNLDRRVAIKTVKVENLSEEAAAEYEHRFRTEARSAARLQHPNNDSDNDSDRDGDIAFLVMEYIHGDDLKHHLDKGERYSLEQSLRMIRDLLSALDYAHKQGIVHRDIKPANLLLEPGGRVKLTDFGVARIQDSGEATRTQGSMVGTLKYMAPEQVQGQKIDSRADLFSVGVVLYQLLTDTRPFDGDNDFSIIHQIISHDPPAPSTITARLPSAIDAVVARALAKTRDARFATARDFAAALQSAIRRAEDQTVVPPPNPMKKREAVATDSRGQVYAAGAVTSPSTVTQEVELVYWKDIKDSPEPEEFEAFQQKFPAGIYADLARKRLRKLAGSGSASTDQTLLSGMGTEAARVRTATTAPIATHASVSAEAAVIDDVHAFAEDPSSTFPSTFTVAVPVVTPAPLAQAMPHEASAAEGASRKQVRAPRTASGSKRPVALVAGVGAVAVAAIAAFMLMGRGSTPNGARSGAPVSAASSPAQPASAIGSASVVSTAAGVAAKPASEAKTAASAKPAVGGKASAAPLAALKAKGTASAVAGETPKQALAPSSAPQEAPKPAASKAASPSSPMLAVEACKEKIFVTREFCLAENCDKPGARSHPLCVEWRADKRLRENSRIGN